MPGGRRWRSKLAPAATAAALAVVVQLAPVRPPAASASDQVAAVRKKVVSAIASAKAKERSVVVIVDGHGVIVDIDSGRALAPASTQKLFTAAAALLALPTDYRARTEVLATFPTFEGVMAGDLVLAGGGDPTLTGSDLEQLAADVHAFGIRQVTGGLFVDDLRYDRARAAPGWKPNWVTEQSGPLSSVAVDRNGWRRDAEFVADPATANGDRFRAELAALGVTIAGETALGRPSGDAMEVVASHESAPLTDVVRPMLKYSDNFVAEMLLKEMGARAGNPTSAGGVEAMWKVADALSLPRGRAADGSGLSSINRASAATEVKWLHVLDQLSVGPLVRDALPVGCVDGTLKTRFCRSPGAGKVHAKTGTLNYITTLAGYTTTAAGHRVWFAMLLSGLPNLAKGRNAIDSAVNAVVASSL